MSATGPDRRVRVAIVGAGPAGSLLSLLLHRAGVSNVVVERQSRAHVLQRIRAGVLEWSSVEVLHDAGVADTMMRDGRPHDGAVICWAGRDLHLDIAARTGRRFMAYGQSPLQADLYAALDLIGGTIVDEAAEVELHDQTTDRPWLTFRRGAGVERIDADVIVGCDGYHGVARRSMPAAQLDVVEKEYPFGWVGVLSETPPLPELVYANSPRGFALASQRNAMLSRYYVQCALTDTVDDWSDDRFWHELLARFPAHIAEQIVTGPSIEKSITPLRSFVASPLRHGSLFLAGDAAHIVPPTGAKGLNLAISDVHLLSSALIARFVHGDDTWLDRYSDVALRRIWRSVRFSWWMTMLLHRLPDQSEFDQCAREAELDYLAESAHAQASFCEQYAGMPFEPFGVAG